MKDFHAAMKKYTEAQPRRGRSSRMNSVDAWVSGLMFQKAVELSGATGVPTTADILAGLAKFDNETLGGVAGGLTFSDPDGQEPVLLLHDPDQEPEVHAAGRGETELRGSKT